MSAAPQMVHQGMGPFLFGCAFYTAFIALGAYLFLRTESFHRAYVAWLQRFPSPSKPGPSVGSTRFVGALFVGTGTALLAFSIYDQFLR